LGDGRGEDDGGLQERAQVFRGTGGKAGREAEKGSVPRGGMSQKKKNTGCVSKEKKLPYKTGVSEKGKKM